VIVSGLNNLAEAGDRFIALRDEKLAKSIANKIAQKQIRQERLFQMQQSNQNLENTKVTNVILRADVNGSIEAIKNLFEKINIDGTTLKMVRSAIGAISESDVKLAKASNALIIGFNVRPTKSVRDLANNIGIKIIFQNVIYSLKDQIEKILIGTLDPVYEEEIVGEAKVQAIFKASSIGTIAGCIVTNGKVVRNNNVRVIRDGIVIYTSTISSLKHLKEDVKEIKEGKECGLTIAGFNDIKENDILECFIDKKVDLLNRISGNDREKK
ncbi:translation initiation factor IF-2, partial [bacterium]|nr:translation initiation factor IF-2 [bacterium]